LIALRVTGAEVVRVLFAPTFPLRDGRELLKLCGGQAPLGRATGRGQSLPPAGTPPPIKPPCRPRRGTSRKDPYELLSALDARRASLAARSAGKGLEDALAAAGVRLLKGRDGDYIDLDVVNRFDDAVFMGRLAALLELPAEWLVLRARESVATARLASVERELKALGQASSQMHL
jgi:hypothetical protein